jgi:GH24 family phage-related lysozyme (muramidase)
MTDSFTPLTPVAGFTADQLFSDDVASFIQQPEGSEPSPYTDIKGIPTFGIGLNLQVSATAKCIFGWRTAVRYMGCLLLTILCVPSARGACLDWSHIVGNGNSDNRLIYFGTVGDHPIQMMLHLDVVTGHFDGAYGYNDQPGMLSLSGNMQPGGVGVDLDERDAQGHVTGHFSLGFFHNRRSWEDPRTYDKYSNKCEALTGSWRSTSGNKTQDVALLGNGEIVPAYDREREMNEITAYKLRRAMLDKNRQAFASLLSYPFYTNGFNRYGGVLHLNEKTWNNPEDVMNNYDKIINYDKMEPFSYKEIIEAVPHALQTSVDGSQFMNGSVYLTHGKVTRICSGRCPVIP